MSVTMHLYRVLPKVKYNGCVLDNITQKALNGMIDGSVPVDPALIENGCPLVKGEFLPEYKDPEYEDFEKWSEKQLASAWSDNMQHDVLDITSMNSCYKDCRGFGRMYKRLLSLPYKRFQLKEYMWRYIPVEEVWYAQGWFFKHKFFNRKCWHHICTTKEQMEHFFERYIDYKDKRYPVANIIQDFLDKWEDGMIFECAW